MATRLLLLGAAASLTAAQNNGTRRITNVAIPANVSKYPLVKDVYGYSLEPVWVDAYTSSDIATNLMSIIGDLTGKPPPFRVGGNTADQTYLHGSQREPSLVFPNETKAEWFNITPAWYDSWADYFPENTDLIYTLNFADDRDAWANAVAQAEAVHESLGSRLTMLELGNEIDHFINKDWRPEGWGVDEYVPEWFNLTSQIVDSDWYKSAKPAPPKFQAAVFADPPWVPDQQDQIDDFDIINVTRAGLVDEDLISAYSVHLYPQSTCDPGRWLRMRLDLLSNHTVLWLNVSQYVPQVAAAHAVGKPIVMGETNSVSCSGRSGISDTFGATLWGIDYVLMAASIGFQKVYFHLGAHSEYSSFTPLPYEYKGESLTAGVRAGFYAHYFIANVVAGDEDYSVAALPGANSSDFSGYAIYGGSSANSSNSNKDLRKLVFLDMAVWNTTEGRSNPSTISATDATSLTSSKGSRPVRRVEVRVPWAAGSSVKALRLNGPGTNAKSGISVSGTTFGLETGDMEGEQKEETLKVRDSGVLGFDMISASGVLLELVRENESGGGSGNGSGGGGGSDGGEDDGGEDGSENPESGAGGLIKPHALWFAVLAGLYLML